MSYSHRRKGKPGFWVALSSARRGTAWLSSQLAAEIGQLEVSSASGRAVLAQRWPRSRGGGAGHFPSTRRRVLGVEISRAFGDSPELGGGDLPGFGSKTKLRRTPAGL